MVDDIVQKIVLQADDQATPVISRLAAQYQASFQQIQAAANQAGVSVEQFGKFSANTQQQYLRMAEGLKAGGVSGVMLEAGAAAKVASKEVTGAGVAATEAAAGFSITRRELSALSRAVREVSGSLGPVAGQITSLGRIGLTFGAPAAAVIALGAAFSGVATALYKFAEGAQETQKSLEGLQKVSGQSTSNLSALQIAFAAGGTEAGKFADEFTHLTEEVAGSLSTNAIRNADKEWVEFNNDIGRVRGQFDNLAQGVKTTFSVLTTLDTKVEAVKESLVRLKDPQAQWLKLADIMKNLSSDLDRAQIGKKLGLSPETIRTLALGSAAVREMQAEVKRLGLELDDLSSNKIKALTESQTKLGALWDALKNKLGALASPAFTSFFQGLADGLKEVSPALQHVAEQFGRLDFSAFGRGLARAGAEVVAWLGDIGEAIAKGDFSGAFSRLTDRMLPAVGRAGIAIGQALIEGMISAAKTGIEQLANVLGTELSLMPQRFVYDLLKNFEILKANLKHAFTGAPIDPPDTSKLDAAWAKISQDAYDTGNKVKKALGQPIDAPDVSKIDGAFNHIIDGANKAGDSIKRVGDVSTEAGNKIVETDKAGTEAAKGQEAANKVMEEQAKRAKKAAEEAAQAALDAARKWRQANAAFFDPMTRQFNIQAYDTSNIPMASGGEVHGPGTATSDSILARLSAGEFVMRTAAVQKYGLGLMHTLNTLRFPGFAAGGLNTPRFVTGSNAVAASTSPRVLNLTIEGRSFAGLQVPERTAQSLERFAVHSQIASTGRKQSWRR